MYIVWMDHGENPTFFMIEICCGSLDRRIWIGWIHELKMIHMVGS